MPTTTVRISEQTHRLLGRLAKQDGLSMQAVMEKALDMYRRHQFLQELNTAYASLKHEKDEWQAVQHERRIWDATLGDGLAETDAQSQLENVGQKSSGQKSSGSPTA